MKISKKNREEDMQKAISNDWETVFRKIGIEHRGVAAGKSSRDDWFVYRFEFCLRDDPADKPWVYVHRLIYDPQDAEFRFQDLIVQKETGKQVLNRENLLLLDQKYRCIIEMEKLIQTHILQHPLYRLRCATGKITFENEKIHEISEEKPSL